MSPKYAAVIGLAFLAAIALLGVVLLLVSVGSGASVSSPAATVGVGALTSAIVGAALILWGVRRSRKQ